MERPQPTEHPAYYTSYINLVPSNDIIKALENQMIDIQSVISEIPEEKENYAYANGKWTIKEVLGHIIDTERILGCRSLRFARRDKTVMPGFDENAYVANANFKNRTLYDLAHEFAIVRGANLALFKQFDNETMSQLGNVNGNIMTVLSVLYMIAGHTTHHINVIKSKYL